MLCGSGMEEEPTKKYRLQVFRTCSATLIIDLKYYLFWKSRAAFVHILNDDLFEMSLNGWEYKMVLKRWKMSHDSGSSGSNGYTIGRHSRSIRTYIIHPPVKEFPGFTVRLRPSERHRTAQRVYKCTSTAAYPREDCG